MPRCFYSSFSESKCKQYAAAIETKSARLEIGGLDDAKIYLASAEVYEAGGYPENAIPAMRRAIVKEPKNDFYRSRYGLLLVNSKAPAALICIEEALKEFPDSGSLWFALGRLYVRQSRWSEAVASFEKAAKLEPNRAETFYQLGRVYVQFKKATSPVFISMMRKERRKTLNWL